MGFTLLVAIQAAGTVPLHVDLARPVASIGCRRAGDDDIVVCGSRTDRYRLPRLPTIDTAPAVPRAETDLFGGRAKGAIEAEAASLPGGMQSNRIMMRLKLPF